jgi:hypothetical protein
MKKQAINYISVSFRFTSLLPNPLTARGFVRVRGRSFIRPSLCSIINTAWPETPINFANEFCERPSFVRSFFTPEEVILAFSLTLGFISCCRNRISFSIDSSRLFSFSRRTILFFKSAVIFFKRTFEV